MKRGEIWTIAGAGGYADKPRPVLILQDDAFAETDSVTVCAITSVDIETPAFRIRLEADDASGLRNMSYVMVDKISTVRRTKLKSRIGVVDRQTLLLVNRATMVFLGLYAST